MNTAQFIVQRLNQKNKGSFSRTVSIMAVISVGIGVMVLLVAFAVLGGFKRTIKDKIFSFDSHIELTKIDVGDGVINPASLSSPFYKELKELEGVKSVSAYSSIVGIIQANEEIEGVTVKGVNEDFDSIRFLPQLIAGKFLDFSHQDEILVSKKLAQTLQLANKDTVLFNVLDGKRVRHRKLRIVGIYETGLEDIDKKLVIGNHALVQKLYKWDSTQVQGFEVTLVDPRRLDYFFDSIYELMDYDFAIQKITTKYFNIFDWLEVIHQNVNFLIVLVFFIVLFNIIAIMAILIMERITMIGMLKAMGATPMDIIKVFWLMGVRLLFRGLIVGNVVGLGFCFLQDVFHIIPLDPVNYYMSFVPIRWDWAMILLVNIGAIITVATMVLLPSLYVTRVTPIKSIKFD